MEVLIMFSPDFRLLSSTLYNHASFVVIQMKFAVQNASIPGVLTSLL